MQIILVRHGTKDRGARVRDEQMPLSPEGKEETERRAKLLGGLGIKPDYYLTSESRHAAETARLLAERLGNGPADIKELRALTPPHSSNESLVKIMEEAHSSQMALEDVKVVAIVGHEPHLSRLLTELTGTRGRPFGRGEVVCVIADSFKHLMTGQGKLAFRYPVVNNGEEQLRTKVQSKMAVSTFLAGFTATVLFELLLSHSPLSVPERIAAISLTGSLALFIAAVYMYDRLSMPEGFWIEEDRPIVHIKRGKSFERDLGTNGLLYALMIWTWNYVFTPAIALGLAGFVVILISRDDNFLLAGALAILVGVGSWYLLFRPRLGVD